MAEGNRLENGHPSNGIVGSNPTLSDFSWEKFGSDFSFRFTIESDGEFLKQWLLEPGVLRGFPMCSELEVDDAVKHWIPAALEGRGITALYQGIPIGLANLNPQPHQRMHFFHLLSIVVAERYRGKGLGAALMRQLLRLAKERLHLEYVLLEVYEGNPAVRLYERMGFVTIGKQPFALRESEGVYLNKVIMVFEIKKGSCWLPHLPEIRACNSSVEPEATPR